MQFETFGEMAYGAIQAEGWDTEEILAREADPSWVEAAHGYAEDHDLPWPPPATERDFVGQIIANAFGL